jgi:Protein of unknown function (DUF1236)
MKLLSIKVLAFALLPTLAMAAGAGGGTGGTGANGSTGGAAPGTAGNAPSPTGGTGGTAPGTAGNAPSTSGNNASTANSAAAPGNSGGAVGKGPEITRSMLPEEPSVTYGQPLEIGSTLPGDFTYYPVPNYDAYNYVILDNQRVIVDRRTRRILEVIP